MQDFYHINDDLLVKYLLGEASADEQQSVKDWISADDANQRYFDHFKLIWDRSKQLAVKSRVDENKAWERFQQRIKNGGQAKVVDRKISFPWFKIAAVVVLVIAIGIITRYLVTTNPNEIIVASAQQVINDTLPDGSMVTLNKRSSISYPTRFKGKSRHVKLEGEAFFNVTPNKEKPFIIQANDVEITVVGTSFNVKTLNGVTEVVVETGIVKVKKDGNTVELRAGERTTISSATAAPAKEEVTDKLYNYYRTREFVCDDTPLWKLVEVVNEAYGVNIVIGREDLKNQKINTPFYNESLDQVLEVIKLTFNLTVKRNGDQIILE